MVANWFPLEKRTSNLRPPSERLLAAHRLQGSAKSERFNPFGVPRIRTSWRANEIWATITATAYRPKAILAILLVSWCCLEASPYEPVMIWCDIIWGDHWRSLHCAIHLTFSQFFNYSVINLFRVNSSATSSLQPHDDRRSVYLKALTQNGANG